MSSTKCLRNGMRGFPLPLPVVSLYPLSTVPPPLSRHRSLRALSTLSPRSPRTRASDLLSPSQPHSSLSLRVLENPRSTWQEPMQITKLVSPYFPQGSWDQHRINTGLMLLWRSGKGADVIYWPQGQWVKDAFSAWRLKGLIVSQLYICC